MEYKIIGYIAIGLLAFILIRRVLINWAISKLVKSEFSHVLNHPDYKVKGRFDE